MLRTAPGHRHSELIEVKFKYNPTQFAIDKEVPWKDHQVTEKDVPEVEFTAGKAMTLPLELLFDEYETGGDVRELHTNRLTRLALVDPVFRRPPLVLFIWGANEVFRGVITNLNITFNMFRAADGIPTRAKATLTLREVNVRHRSEEPSPRERTTAGPGVVAQAGSNRADRYDPKTPRAALDAAGGAVDERGQIPPGTLTHLRCGQA